GDRAASEQMSELVAELHKMGSEQSVSISTGADRTILRGTVVMLVSGLLIGVFSLWMVNRNLVQPIRNLIAYVTQLSHGRFSERVVSKRQDELGDL
ncbi:HAMP domain-containing protein, partial [Pseudomonas brassicacearum]|uniref:HAMP domain-containing protein n=1 Tax=Pseudomonas brassicacearum TaxID=930166 RepID=UPI000F48B706